MLKMFKDLSCQNWNFVIKCPTLTLALSDTCYQFIDPCFIVKIWEEPFIMRAVCCLVTACILLISLWRVHLTLGGAVGGLFRIVLLLDCGACFQCLVAEKADVQAQLDELQVTMQWVTVWVQNWPFNWRIDVVTVSKLACHFTFIFYF